CVGIRRGYDGLLDEDRVVLLDANAVRGITHLGGTILGTTNRGDPFRWRRQRADGTAIEHDRADELVAAFHRKGIDALIAIGGDGSLRIAQRLFREKGISVVGVPKTIDNDVGGTQLTFGFDTAVQTATEAIDKVHSTAESHERVMVVEVMGRHAGWIALHSGISGSADVILMPEIPFGMGKVWEKTACWACASAPRRCASSPKGNSAPWSRCVPPRSPRSRSTRRSPPRKRYHSIPTRSLRHAISGSPWETDARRLRLHGDRPG